MSSEPRGREPDVCQVLFSDEADLDGGIAAIRAQGLEADIKHIRFLWMPSHRIRCGDRRQ